MRISTIEKSYLNAIKIFLKHKNKLQKIGLSNDIIIGYKDILS